MKKSFEYRLKLLQLLYSNYQVSLIKEKFKKSFQQDTAISLGTSYINSL